MNNQHIIRAKTQSPQPRTVTESNQGGRLTLCVQWCWHCLAPVPRLSQTAGQPSQTDPCHTGTVTQQYSSVPFPTGTVIQQYRLVPLPTGTVTQQFSTSSYRDCDTTIQYLFLQRLLGSDTSHDLFLHTFYSWSACWDQLVFHRDCDKTIQFSTSSYIIQYSGTPRQRFKWPINTQGS